MLPNEDQNFFNRRRQLVENWKFIGYPAGGLVLGLCLFLWFTSPLLINPFHVVDRVNADAMAHTTLLTSAVILPVVTLLLVGMMLFLLFFMFRAFAHERRYIDIILALQTLDHKRVTDGPE